MTAVSLPLLGEIREGFRRRERLWVWLYLAAVALFLAVLALPALRRPVLDRLQHGVSVWDDRWLRRLEFGEQLVAQGRYAEAVPFLARLDQDFPAQDVRHGRDKERERLLLALGRAYASLGKKGKALDTYHRLVAFDPLNYRNQYALALLSDHFLSGWALAPEARDAYAAVLKIHPSHLPSVRSYANFYSQRGEFPEVTRAYEAYLDAFLIQAVEIRLGDSSFSAPVQVDGRWQDVEIPLNLPVGWHGALSIATDGFAAGLERVTLLPALRVGELSRAHETVLFPGATIQPERMSPVRDGVWLPSDSTPVLTLQVPALPAGADRLHLRLRLFKPVDASFWSMVRQAYKNNIDWSGLAAADERTIPFKSAASADSVLERQYWAHEGLAGRPPETGF